MLEVKDVPPAPTIADLNPANRHTACPNQGIVLNGTPPEQNYNLVWAPACSTATPQLYSGDSVTISYQSEVCDVRVYNYDMVLQCMSTDYYVHQVTALTPAPLNLPPTITACPGTVINWTTGQIPDQRSEGMLYEWTIEDNKQHCVSVQGSHFNPGIILAVNDISTPETLFVRLRRTFCGGSVDTTIYIFVPGEITESLNISGPGNVCVGSSASFTGSGGSPATYRWEIDGTQHTNNPVSHTFLSEGYSDVRLCSNPFTYCTNLNYYNCTTKTVLVTPLPTVYDIVRNGMTVSLLPANLTSPAYSFYWTVQTTASSSAIYIGNTPTVTLSIPGTYSCTVTDNNTGCSRTLQKYLPDVIGCDTMTLSTSYNACTHTLTLISPQYPANVIWDVRGGNYSIVTSGTNNRQADVTFEDIGTYSITARTGYNQCYKGTYVKTIDYIPDFEFEQVCGNINIINNSRYISPGNTIYMTVTNSCNNSVDIVSMPINHSEYTYAPTTLMPTGTCTYYFKLSGYGTNGNITPLCDLGDITVTMVSTPSNPVTITSANLHNTCDNTPIELTATLNIPGLSVTSYTWDFDDGSGYTTYSSSIFHTFEYPGNSPYYISVTLTDNLGCTYTTSTPFLITSHSNPIHGGQIYSLDPEVCPFSNIRNLYFDRHFNDNHYVWWRHKATTQTPNIYPYPASQSDDYFTYVVNDNYCQAEATTFIKFKNAPTAHIYVENTDCCVENEVKLYGSTGPGDNNVTYAWSVSGLGITGSEANFAFSPPVAGTYTVTLTVTNTTTLCSSTTTETITAHPKPAAPTISFVGSDCISDAPLRLAATGYTGEMHWNNGATGTPVYYFTPGVMNAYYFDPTIGCNSDTANLTIIRQPDLDALLTGCYEKCKEQSTGLLPLYGLAAYYQQIWYQWDYPGGTITDNYLYDSHPLLLPYMIGNHYLTASAPSSLCPRTSSVLRIAGKEVCDCDSVDITYNVVPVITECTVTYSVEVVVCNRSKVNSFCIGEFEVLYAQNTAQIIYESLSGNTVAPNDCEDFLVKILVTSLVPSELLIRLTDDRCANCTKDFSIDLMPEINCTETMDAGLDDIKSDISSSVATYFDFHAYFTPGQNVLAFWTEPPMVVNYSYNISSGALAGLGMIDMATLTQLIAEGEKLCFYAIVCKNNTLCKQELCIDASNIYNIIMMRSAHAADSAKSNPRGDVGGLQLMPNPTTGDVNVVGTTDEVVDMVVMDMHGKEVATHEGTASFNVATLSSGTYIVRVKTRKDDKSAEMVAYLKLVKK